MARLELPTDAQLACEHVWRVRSRERAHPLPWPRVRYVRCLRCDLRVRTVEYLDELPLGAAWLARYQDNQPPSVLRH